MNTSPSEQLTREFDNYRAKQSEMVAQYNGRVIVLKGGEVIGVFESELAAMTETKKTHEVGTFLIQKVSEGEEAYSQTYQSRVAFL